MLARIEGLPFRPQHSDPELGECVLQLPVNKFDSTAQLRLLPRRLQGAFQTVSNRQQRLQGVGNSVFPEIRLLARGTLAEVIELSLQPR